ncbi:hypothetical protein [Candidatus Hodgkinia cicadicola]|uniref:hypothetical protein n=1 Tax=Candidatus Hodgkinia cicadicola TaxID=573658 RepID=UPI001788AF94
MFSLFTGLLSGHKIAGIKFRLIDGGHNIVDSSELAFNMATQGAIKQSTNWISTFTDLFKHFCQNICTRSSVLCLQNYMSSEKIKI